MNAVTAIVPLVAINRRPTANYLLILSIASSLSVAAEIELPSPVARPVDYINEVQPLLSKYCYECHGLEKQQSGLRLDRRQNALRGGDYGPVIIPGKSAESRLIRKLVDGDGGDRMPPENELTPEEVSLLRAWIDQGADFRNDVGPEPLPKSIDPQFAELIAAVRSEPQRVVEKLLAANPHLLNANDPAKSTLLHHAAAFGHIETLSLLIDAGAEVNAINRRGSTPLHWAIHDLAKVRLLISRGADINKKQAEGRTPLFLAAMLGDGYATVKVLLEGGADANIKAANGRTPLMMAAVRGEADVLHLLIQANAAVNAQDSAGETALMVAASGARVEAVRLLLESGADARIRTKRDESALGNAGTAGNEVVVRLLLEHGAEVNTRNIRGFSPLMLAAGSDVVPVGAVKLLLEKGADLSLKGDYDETARDLAAKRGDTEVARLLGHVATKTTSVATGPRQGGDRPALPDAVERALLATEKQSYNFIRVGSCNSCHSQDRPSAAAAFARSRGFNAPREIPQLPSSNMPPTERVLDLDFVTVASKAWELFDFGMNGAPKTAYTDAVVRLIKAMQGSDGRWATAENRRPPMGAGDFQSAALSIYSLRHYAPAGDEKECQQALDRAVAWLKRAEPSATQDRAFHLLGLAWGGAMPEVKAVAALAAMQRPDGGWSQLPTMESDAYATGLAMYALHSSGGLGPLDEVYRKGVDYLLRTQASDGTWRVKTRAIWLQPYFESGFPYEKDQFISTAGTAWASMALAATRAPTFVHRE